MPRKPSYGSAAEFFPDKLTLPALKAAAAECKACDLWKRGTQTVFGEGRKRSTVLFVGEQPGNEEDLSGKPFVGPAGRLFDSALDEAGLDRSQTYVTNVVKHFKWEPRGKRRIHKKPNAQEISACRPWLEAEISLVKPKVIVALGATAAKTLLALAMNSSMIQLRGRFYDFRPAGIRSNDPNWDGCKLAVTYHPAFLLRDPRQKGEAWKDLQMVMKELGLKAPKPNS